MDQLHTRLDDLEQHIQTLHQHTRTVTRRLRWWRGLACGLLGLAVLTWALPAGLAKDDSGGGKKDLEQRVAALEKLLKHFSRKGDDVTITGANLHLVNGLGETDCTDENFDPIPDCPNGLGNLIVGYNESRTSSIGGEDIRTGSHNIVVGQEHNFSRVGGLVVGRINTISGDFASVSGGAQNTASGAASAGRTTLPAAGSPWSAEERSIGLAALWPWSAGDRKTRPAPLMRSTRAVLLPLAGGVATQPAASSPPSAAGRTG